MIFRQTGQLHCWPFAMIKSIQIKQYFAGEDCGEIDAKVTFVSLHKTIQGINNPIMLPSIIIRLLSRQDCLLPPPLRDFPLRCDSMLHFVFVQSACGDQQVQIGELGYNRRTKNRNMNQVHLAGQHLDWPNNASSSTHPSFFCIQ